MLTKNKKEDIYGGVPVSSFLVSHFHGHCDVSYAGAESSG